MTAPSPAHAGLIAAARLVLEAEDEFRDQLSITWEGDPLSDAIDCLRAALASEGEPQPVAADWRDISTAPQDGTVVWVYAPADHELDPIMSLCAWHEDGGWCVDEVRVATLWCPLILPASPHPTEEAGNGE